ncbi:MAG: hypothetical protein FWG73_09405 [Planctomycetaceae bacterium]|nr:hypothetical protein [Planctomycetaceae bacterium]
MTTVMPIIYTPRGKALEYSDLAANLYTGCSHACRYCYCPAIVTREALLILERHGLRVQVLTKGGKRTIGDFDILARNDWKFGSTIIFLNEKLREEWEPGAASIVERIEAVREAHRRGIFTWISVEPVVDASEALLVMRELREVVDFWKVGKLNHDKQREAAIDWRQFLWDTEAVLAGKNYMIKQDLEKFRADAESGSLLCGHPQCS